MGLESIATSILDTVKFPSVDANELTKYYDDFVKSNAVEVLLEILNLCTIQGGFAFNQYFQTYSSWFAIPKLAFIPFHKCKETYYNTSEAHENTQEIQTYVQRTKEAYKGVPPETLKDNPNIQKILNLNTSKISDTGIIEYKNFLVLDAEYWMEQQGYLIDTQFFKVGYPNILKFLRVCLDTMPYLIPAYFYSRISGGISMPWYGKRLASHASETSQQDDLKSSQVYILNKFEYTVSEQDRKVSFKITLLSSAFGIYSISSEAGESTTDKTNQAQDSANKHLI